MSTEIFAVKPYFGKVVRPVEVYKYSFTLTFLKRNRFSVPYRFAVFFFVNAAAFGVVSERKSNGERKLFFTARIVEIVVVIESEFALPVERKKRISHEFRARITAFITLRVFHKISFFSL